VHQQIMGQIMMANLKDESQSWLLHASGKYTRIHPSGKTIPAHDYFIKNPSLSGRGSALHLKG
jgi:polyphosphate kinase